MVALLTTGANYRFVALAIPSPTKATAPAAMTPPTAAAPPNTPRPIRPSEKIIIKHSQQQSQTY